MALHGCVAFPELPGGARVDIVDIINNIECEMQAAIIRDLPRHYWLLGWAATFTLLLQTKNEPDGSGDVSISVPLMPETFGLSLSIAAETCPPPNGEAKSQKPVLTGRTGAGDWLVRVADDSTLSGICPQSIDFSLDFRIKLTGDGNPKITGIEVGDGKLSLGSKLEAKCTKEHKISFTAAPVADSRNKDEQKKVDAIFATARQIVRDQLGAQFDKTDIRDGTPLDPAFRVVRRGPINEDTLDDLDAADLRAILRALPTREPQ